VGIHLGATWRKSKRSAAHNGCVEVAVLAPGQIGVRDSKAGAHSPVLVFGTADWASFLRTIREGGHFGPA